MEELGIVGAEARTQMLGVGCRGKVTPEFGLEGEKSTGIQWDDPVPEDWMQRTLALG